MKRTDVCPSCGKALQWEPPDEYGMCCGSWVCSRCKYRRPEGSAKNPLGFMKRKKRRRDE